MTPEKLSARHVTTLLFLLRNHAARQRFEHGPMVERPGGIELTPTEMEAWADEIEATHALPGKPAPHCEYHKQFEYDCMECIDLVQPPKALPDNSGDSWLTT